ncbi:ABC transporter permease subunit [Rhodobacteraceae bacterium HSP-20]|uniref:ABC transporter permease subunit n=1 Tax=Paragemmobacter amnigenus TaxID=2852097 RepID=A0ABS6J8I5_9RHOB|nr:ABC transporter permease subunit [Rhodobacter amnigenus]MBU9700039.1 ABC transporter permease subunit [Rhodobacter amnigenus]MBV4391266.1 ABC transporter permease subunit [Rhodobacter amnigenus]
MKEKALLSPGEFVAPVISWLNTNAHGLFKAISTGVEAVLGLTEAALLAVPGPILAPVIVLLILWRQGVSMALLAAGCMAVAGLSGLWVETMQTVALVTISVLVAVVIAFPLGFLAAKRSGLESALRPILDLMQTVPPWVYLIPAVMIFSLGKVPALLATVIYGVPPMLRLTTLAFKQVPKELRELGAASGATGWQTLTRIEIPSARKTLLIGLNQCILLSLAMVVLAGLVGAGGLGAEVTRGLTRMEMGLGLRSGLSIVAVAIFMDRLSRRALG